MTHTSNDTLDQLEKDVRGSAKYRYVVNDIIRDIGAQALRKYPKYKDAVKATKNKLHQVGGAYFDVAPRYDDWLERISQVNQDGEVSALKPICRQMMQQHASTRERLPDLDIFYDSLFSRLPPIHSILDVACGMNPLSIPWMKLEPGSTYYAVDIYEDLMHFLQQFIAICGYQAETRAASVLGQFPVSNHVDLALVLKTIPCLEQLDKTAAQTLLDGIEADFIFVTFPAHSLGGRAKGMAANYTAHFNELVADKSWRVEPFDFPDELAFLLFR